MTNQTNTTKAPAVAKTEKRGRGRPRRMARPPEGNGTTAAAVDPALATSAPSAPRPNKTTAVVALLARPDGATLAELIEATGWLPHTTRASLTGLRKRGHTVERFQRDHATCYRVAGIAQ